ncbi:MAG: hypothetical protein IJY22_00350 [Clostridia bacterium]|nr:hypothetical protein [Clostridia bacterium]
MKKTISLLLAILMIVTAMPVFGFVAAAEGEDLAEPTVKYVVYAEDFDGVPVNGDSSALLTALGWYVPEGEVKNDIATYTITAGKDGQGNALRVSTTAPKGLETDSIVTVFGGDVMALVREGDYTVSYDLTYRAGTTNTKGYSTLIYNYNEKSGAFVGNEGEGAAYGYAPVRVCGTGFNNVYYPISGGSTNALVEARPNEGEYVMSNGYTELGAYSSLYSKIAATLGDETYTDAVINGSESTLIDKTLSIRLEVDYEEGTSVYVNDILVSVPATDYSYVKYSGNFVWQDFVGRTEGASVALLTKHNVVADIDNIKIESETVGGETVSELPELVITDLSPAPHETWGEYIEVYNTSDRYINLAEYALMFCDVTDGAASDVVSGNNHKKFAGYVNLSTVLGQPIKSGTNYYKTNDEIQRLGEHRFEYVNSNRYSLQGTSYVVNNETGIYRLVKYVENWNTRYTVRDTADPSVEYDSNTYVAPGECVLFHPMLGNDMNFWEYGVNAGDLGKSIYGVGVDGYQSFRDLFAQYGLSENTKVVAFTNFNLADNCNRRYYIGKANDADGNAIAWTGVYNNDPAYDEYIVSYCDWNSPISYGKPAETAAPGLSGYGQVGAHEKGYGCTWVYGVDGSADPRRGVLYATRVKTNNWQSTVGRLAGYQDVLFNGIYKKNDGTAADLTITEIVPRTNDLVGKDNSAFTAMELTNTSNEPLNLYRYALVRTELGPNCNAGKGFTRSVIMRSGNPVDKGLYNGAYYYFMEDHISNPESCILQPGETAVVWFLSTETYTTYAGDDDFGFEYFREYWVNNGSPQMAMKTADGEYATKVIAVDGHEGTTFNADNAKRVFELSPTSAAIYGIAPATYSVKQGVINTQEVLSAAYLGIAGAYYNLEWTTFVEDSKTYYVNQLEFTTMPANMGMRYVAGGAGSSKCSVTVDTLRVQYWERTEGGDHVWYTEEEGKLPIIVVVTNNALQEPKLGTLNGKETKAILDYLFVSEEDEAGNITYNYFDWLRADILTLEGAALNTAGENPGLRFDNAIPAQVYAPLAAAYGEDQFKIGMLIVDSSYVKDMDIITREQLDAAGILYEDVKSELLYRTEDFAVLGSTIEVAGNYETSYTAIGYMEITLADGTTKTYWSPSTTERSVVDVAEKAWEDTQEEADEIYCYETMDGLYSRYTPEIQEKLCEYLGIW